MPSSSSDEVTTLRVAVCQVAVATSSTSERRRVICPLRSQGVSVESCLRCVRCVDIVRDSTRAASAVRCALPARLLRRQRLGRRVSRLAAETSRVSSLLARDVLCVSAELPAAEAAALLVDARASEAVVVDARRRPVGLVAEADLLAADADADADARAGNTVEDFMSAVAITLVETATLATAAALLARDRLSSLPVVDAQGCVVGLLTPFDLVEWLAPSP